MAGFALGKWDSSHTGTGIWSLGMGKNVKNQKWEWDLRITKWDLEKNELGNGIGTPVQNPLFCFPQIVLSVNKEKDDIRSAYCEHSQL